MDQGAEQPSSTLRELMPPLPIIAEVPRVITPGVEARPPLSGMRILHSAFGNDDRADEFVPTATPPIVQVHRHTTTTRPWAGSTARRGPAARAPGGHRVERKMILDYLRTDGHEIHWDLINLGSRSTANIFVVPLQDLLGLPDACMPSAPAGSGGSPGTSSPRHPRPLRHITRHRADALTARRRLFPRAPDPRCRAAMMRATGWNHDEA